MAGLASTGLRLLPANVRYSGSEALKNLGFDVEWLATRVRPVFLASLRMPQKRICKPSPAQERMGEGTKGGEGEEKKN